MDSLFSFILMKHRGLVFFLEYARGLCIIIFEEKRFEQYKTSSLAVAGTERKQGRLRTTLVDSEATPEPSTPKFFAPALIHCSASALITASSSSTVSAVTWKQRRSFQICQETRANSESAPFLAGPCHRARRANIMDLLYFPFMRIV